MKVKINQDPKFWIQMYIDRFGLTRKEAEERIKPFIIKTKNK
tara:strand:+ start:602 stop:727 length:126 start_codon:yes stop_codon:yes gene_type:complete